MIKFWWVLFFFLICFMFYEQQLQKKNDQFITLTLNLHRLQKQKKELVAQQEDFLLQINSQSDPDWIELTLMRRLGLVPEGYTKVYFNEDSSQKN